MSILAGCTSAPPTTTGTSNTGTTATESATPAATPQPPVGPGTAAVPLVIVRELPQGGTCAYDDRTLRPTVVIYDDGAVLASDSLGFFCDHLPTVTAGWTDSGPVARRVDRYFASGEAAVQMMMGMGVADASVTAGPDPGSTAPFQQSRWLSQLW